MPDFKGKHAIVTGGTQGLGAAIARRLAEDGVTGLVICGRNAENGNAVARSISKATGTDVRFVQADLGRVADCEAVMAEASRDFGTIDMLVNAAATTARGGILDTTPELFDEIFALNTRAPFLLMQSAIRTMLRDGIEGSILNIASMSAHGGQSFLTPYSASKAALVSMTRNVAWSVIAKRIRVNALNIGWMESDQEKALHAAQGHDEDWFRERSAELPFGRLLQPDEVARVAAFILSSDSGMMTGSIVDFDQTILGTRDDLPPPPEL
ncbi:SDR family oxidoreductase [Oricola sp.]|uniref:SDR family oxidoreductase n=1 Tax=Oricola sp. TaxID=1979950 RepID=UPI003BA8B779